QRRGPRPRQPLRSRDPGAVLRGEGEVVFPLRGLRPHTLGISGASPPDPDLLFPRGKSRQKHTQEGDTFDCVPLLGTSPRNDTKGGIRPLLDFPQPVLRTVRGPLSILLARRE